MLLGFSLSPLLDALNPEWPVLEFLLGVGDL